MNYKSCPIKVTLTTVKTPAHPTVSLRGFVNIPCGLKVEGWVSACACQWKAPSGCIVGGGSEE